MCYVELYFSTNLRWSWSLHVEISSFRLFRVAMCGLVKIDQETKLIYFIDETLPFPKLESFW